MKNVSDVSTPEILVKISRLASKLQYLQKQGKIKRKKSTKNPVDFREKIVKARHCNNSSDDRAKQTPEKDQNLKDLKEETSGTDLACKAKYSKKRDSDIINEVSLNINFGESVFNQNVLELNSYFKEIDKSVTSQNEGFSGIRAEFQSIFFKTDSHSKKYRGKCHKGKRVKNTNAKYCPKALKI